MRKIIVLVLLFIFTTSANVISACSNNSNGTEQTQTYVYICNSSGAKVYHSSPNCRGLNRCSHGVIKVTLDEAVNKYGRRPCKVCE